MRESPSATLLYAHPHPFALIYDLFHHDKHGTPLRPPRRASDEEFEFVLQLLKEDWCGLLEFPTYVWQMVLPRSFHAQVRVHRHWSFFSQSHQLYEPAHFADEGDYFKIPGLTPLCRDIERSSMKHAEDAYGDLREAGVLPSLARGVLPMHINLGLSVGMNLRSLFQVAVERRCHILQGTYWNPLLDQMSAALCALDERYARLFELQPCDISGRCLSAIEQELRVKGKDPHAVCPRYLAMTARPGATCCGRGCKGCLKHAREHGVAVERDNHR